MSPQDVPTWIITLSNFGFPIAITTYLLLRFEKKIENLTSVIEALIDTLNNK